MFLSPSSDFVDRILRVVEIHCSPDEVSQFLSLALGQQEHFLRTLYCKIIKEASLRIKQIQPFHADVIKKYDLNVTMMSMVQQYKIKKVEHDVLTFVRVECEFYAKGVKRALDYASHQLRQPFDSRVAEKSLGMCKFHLHYVEKAGDVAIVGKEALKLSEQLSNSEGYSWTKNQSLFDIVRSKKDPTRGEALKHAFIPWIAMSYTSAERALMEYEILNEIIRELKNDSNIKGFDEEIREATSFYNKMKETSWTLQKRTDSQDKISDRERNDLLGLGWSKEMMRLRKRFSEMEGIIEQLVTEQSA